MNFSFNVSCIYLQIPILGDLRQHPSHLDSDQLDGGEDDDVVVKHHSDKEDAEPNQLKEEEALPTNGHADHPDDEGPDTVQHHPGGGSQLLGHGDASKVKEGN